MKKNIISIFSGIALLTSVTCCQDPHEFQPDIQDEFFDSLTAQFYDDDRDENSFPAEVDYAARTITFVFPYNYPVASDNILVLNDLDKIRVSCNLKTGYVLNPPLVSFDFSKDNYVDVIDPYGKATRFKVMAEIRKSAECELLDFSLPDFGLNGIITGNTITLITAENLGETLASVTVSHGATMDPDPRTTALNYDNEPQFTVIAQNGVDQRTYTVVKGDPARLPFGMRAESAKIAWTKKLVDIGIADGSDNYHGATGLAVSGNYLIVNNVGEGNAVILDKRTGTVVSTLDLSVLGTAADGSHNNYSMTSDDDGNIIINSDSKANGGVFTIWTMKNIEDTPSKLLSISSGYQIGNQVSVSGSMNSNAIITASLNGTSVTFNRWIVKDGRLQSQTPTAITISGYSSTCWGNYDVVYPDPADPNSNYCGVGYSAFSGFPTTFRSAVVINGATNAIASYGTNGISSNWVENAIDYCVFNGVGYLMHNSVNTFNWGSDDSLYLFDMSTGDLSNPALDFSSAGLNVNTQYGATAANKIGRAGNGNDVIMDVPGDGFYLYMYFMFTNGSVGCITADCIDM